MARSYVVSVTSPYGTNATGFKASDDIEAVKIAADIVGRKIGSLDGQSHVEIMRDDATMMDVRMTVEEILQYR